MTRENLRHLLSAAKVGIAGAGGLGSNCAAALARAGIGSLVIADFDRVSESNLDRQFYFRDQIGMPKVEALAQNLVRIDPTVRISAHIIRLDPESVVRLFSDCDVVVEALDDVSAKTIIVETVLSRLLGTPIVSVSGLAGIGHFKDIRVERHGDLFLCGDFEREVGPDLPPVAPRVGIVANLEADIVLEILTG
jgi:sulfur carrier protein ThiS adenylyltransferase